MSKILKILEKQLEKLHKELSEIEKTLEDPDIYESRNKENLQKQLTNQTMIKNKLQETEDAWIIACEQRDKE